MYWDWVTTPITKTLMITAGLAPSSIFSHTLVTSLSEAPRIVPGSSHGPLQHLQSRYWLRTKEPERVIDIFLFRIELAITSSLGCRSQEEK